MNSTIAKYTLYEINEIIKETLQLISDKEQGINTSQVEKTYELQAILNDLNKIKAQILTNTLPPKEQRFVSYEEFIIEEWGIRHTLGSRLLDLATKYTNSL